MKRFLSVFIFVLLGFQSLIACKYTVREIGFSTLSQDVYSLVLVDPNALESDYRALRKQLNDINIQLLILHPDDDVAHPYVNKILRDSIPLPAKLIFAPDGRSLVLNEFRLTEIVNILTESPLQKNLLNELVDVFAIVLFIEGSDVSKNKSIEQKLISNCEQISNLMPHMPKIVKKKPLVFRVSTEDFKKEKIILWVLGIEKTAKDPSACVLYGRGRIMGDVLTSKFIEEDNVFKLLSMIGADCECGLNRKWMLGNQIPLLWTQKTRQDLTNELGFDVDNPMVLAEMSRILAKEVNEESSGTIGYGLESIDLNQAFNQLPKTPTMEKSDTQSLKNWLWYIISSFVTVIGIGVFLFYRNQNK